MMTYNRYIPGADGRYEYRRVVACPQAEETEKQTQQTDCNPEHPAAVCAPKPLLRLPDAGDLLVLLVLLLILVDGEETDNLTTMITLVAFLLLR